MTTGNPFEDVEREAAVDSARHLEMAQELDQMDRDVTSWEAGFLDDILRQLEIRKIPLTPGQAVKLGEMYEFYGLGRR